MKKVGSYTLLSELGAGQFGTVYKAKHNETNETFAAKSIAKSGVNSSPKMKELFDTEVKIMSNIKHPNIMHLYELLETSNNYYLILDYCRSGDMEHYVHKHKGLGEEEAVYLLMQIMNGFKELHSLKIMHRDFKLANIFLNDDRVVIGDFGFAKSGKDMAVTRLGSPVTMAPEILLHKNGPVSYTNKADLWSIGVCFYEMIFGCEPWPDVRSVDDLCGKIVKFSGNNLIFEPPKSKFRVSPECKSLLISLIQLDPHKRMSWDQLYKHPLFTIHNGKKQAASDMNRSIMFRNNQDDVQRRFEENQQTNLPEVELNQDPVQNQQFTTIKIQQYQGPAKAELVKQRIIDRFTHEKRVMTFMIQTSVKLRNLSKDKLFQSVAPSLMYCGIFLLKKAIFLNQIAIDALKRNINIYSLEDYNLFGVMPERQKLIEVLEFIDTPNYNRLFQHLMSKIESEIKTPDNRTQQILALVKDNSAGKPETINQELKTEVYSLLNFFAASSANIPTDQKLQMLEGLSHLYLSFSDKESFPFLQEGIPFDWNLFDRSFDGHNGNQKMNSILNKAMAQK